LLHPRRRFETLYYWVVQQALRQVLEPVFEADFYQGSYAYRPGRRAQDAIEEIYRFAKPHSGYSWVIEGDIKACFDNVNHGILLNKLRERVTDRKLLRLAKRFLKAGVITELGQRRSTLTGKTSGWHHFPSAGKSLSIYPFWMKSLNAGGRR